MKLCEDIQKTTLPSKYVKYSPRGGFGTDLIALAAAVEVLQEKRHQAEYDPLFRVKTSDATLVVATARAALQHLRNASRTIRNDFFLLLAFSPR
jgi:hypothetical protein